LSGGARESAGRISQAFEVILVSGAEGYGCTECSRLYVNTIDFRAASFPPPPQVGRGGRSHSLTWNHGEIVDPDTLQPVGVGRGRTPAVRGEHHAPGP